ncbi:MAG: thioredoxin domain-containing protein [Minisyncoccia bacterium]
MENNNKNQVNIAGAIIIAGVIIAGAILINGKTPVALAPVDGVVNNLANIKIRPVSVDEHILGNPNAKIVIVEYSDSECPFCKVFDTTMHEVVEKGNGQVAWVYRHYPIAELHPKAFRESEAMECAWEQGGNTTFWKYSDELFLRTTSNNRLDVAELPKIAFDIGLDLNTFNTCLDTGKYSEKVRADMSDGVQAGVNGTPSGFILKNGKIVDTIPGAQSAEIILQKIEKIK